MKRQIPALLLAVILLLALPVTARAAETELNVRGPTAAPAVGEDFSVTLELRGNPGICVFQATLLYDSARLECTEVITGDALADMLTAENPCAEDPTGAIIAAISASPQTADGVLAEFRFRVLEDGAAVPRILYDTQLADENGKALAFTVVHTLPDGTVLGPADGVKGLPFPDTAGHKEESFILRAAAMGLFDGFPDGTFRPNEGVTRAQFVTVLWRMAGKPAASQPAPFEDVPPDAWYADAVAWGWETGAVNGRSETVFDPDGAVTRQEAMKVIFLYAGGVSGLEALFTATYDSAFADSGEIADWAKSAMYWGFFNGLIGEQDDTVLRPTDAATRAELARMLVRCGEIT